MIKDRLGRVVGLRLPLGAGSSPAQADPLRAARAASGDCTGKLEVLYLETPPTTTTTTWIWGFNLSLSRELFCFFTGKRERSRTVCHTQLSFNNF